MPAPDEEALAQLTADLRADAARIQTSTFDLALHQTILRRIRSLDVSIARRDYLLKPALIGCAALLLIISRVGMPRLSAPHTSEYPASSAFRCDFRDVLASTRGAVAGVSSFSSWPAWMSPTASLLPDSTSKNQL
ncbi:MAG: hypothetical protein JOZ08_16775 [Verrucomicrobia bacterium]|nr:hypothetical protein [Verrucomicrobiota bacterium]